MTENQFNPKSQSDKLKRLLISTVRMSKRFKEIYLCQALRINSLNLIVEIQSQNFLLNHVRHSQKATAIEVMMSQ